MSSNVGVVVDHPEPANPGFGVYVPGGGKVGGYALRTAQEICEVAHMMGLDALWVLPGSRLSFRAGTPDLIHDLIISTEVDVRSHLTRKDKITCLHVWKKEGTWSQKRTIRILFPEHDLRWGLEGLRDYKRLHTVISRLENSLGVALDWSPGHTGKSLMIDTNQGQRASWIEYGTLQGMPINHDTIAKDGHKKYLPDMSDLDHGRKIYFHAYDKNYGYGGCMTSVNLGQGAPEYYSNPLAIRWDEKFPGLWKIRDKWYWTPELNYLFATSEGFLSPEQIEEAWCWTLADGRPRYHQTLRPYAEKLWQVAATCDDPTIKAVSKEIRSQSGGWLAHERKHDEPEFEDRDPLYRPDWWWMIVSTMRAKMNWKIRSLAQKGYQICWWNVDQLGFMSNDPDYRSAGRDIMFREKFGQRVETSRDLGGFKHSYTLLVDDEILHALSDECDFKNAHKILLAKERRQRVSMEATMLVEEVHHA